jgi:hypothetical protein
MTEKKTKSLKGQSAYLGSPNNLPQDLANVADVLDILQAVMLERRTIKITEINNRLQALKESSKINLQGLSNNEPFVDISAKAISLSLVFPFPSQNCQRYHK